MLPRADLTTNRPPGSVEPPTPVTSATDTRQEVLRRLSQIAIGKELTAMIQAKLDDGTHLVKVADTLARMALPVGAKVGDQLSMVFVAREPRPTFLLTGQPASATASLSTAARLIDHLLQTAPRGADVAVVRGSAPLLAAAGSNVPQLTARLQQTLSSSGLFYESHLQDWVTGSRPLAELAREPQAKLPLPSDARTAPEGQDLARLSAGLRELGDNAQALARLIRDAQLQGNLPNLDAQVVARPEAGLPVLDPEAARLLQQQLATLEQQQIRWQGQLFPGQPMEWDVTEERSQSEPENREASAWTSVVRFELPNLGPVEATVRLDGERVQVQVRVERDGSAAPLREFAPLLAEALEAAGSPLEAFGVKFGGERDSA